MNVIIPIGGRGIRFKNEDYNLPKILTPVLGKEIIFWVLNSLKLDKNDCVTIIYNNELEQYNLEERIQKKFNFNFNFIKLPFQTSGPVDTILYGLSKLPESILNDEILIHDGDSFIKSNIISKINKNENKIFYTIDTDPSPIYSYISLDNNKVVKIKEKEKISDFANIGCYTFSSAHTFIKYANMCDKKFTELYISHVYNKMVENDEIIYGELINKEDFICFGTPLQIIKFCNSTESSEKLKFCFDLDNTLVTYPDIKGDYTTVRPIQKNITFLKHLKSHGHYIIIYTARRMLTHKGNVSKILKDIGKITFDTLEKFDIPYDEICFGKPHADYYIDDLAVNTFSNLEKETGFYINYVVPRNFNSVEIKDNTIIKKSTKDLKGEIFYYQNIPNKLSKFFPKLISTSDNSLEIEKINGILLSTLYSNKQLNFEYIDLLFKTLSEIHEFEVNDTSNVNIYNNYSKKLTNRYENYNYINFLNSDKIYKNIKQKLIDYENYNLGKKTIIHGDYVLSNIFLENNSLKLIDMRGKIDDILTIYGDMFYDYAKLYQSLIGYDFILNNKPISFTYTNSNVKYFEKKFIERFDYKQLEYLKYLTASLLFTLIPLHNDKKCQDYYNLINYLI